MRGWIATILTSAAVGVLVLSTPEMTAQPVRAAQMEARQADGAMVQQIRKKLSGLTDYDVFDWITFQIQGNTVVLNGYASRPILKSEAARVVKGVQGVETVDNQIKVLPLSTMDDQIRIAVYDKLYRNPALSRYNANQGGFRPFGGRLGMAGGVINDPPMGYHAIHIIVDNGHVTLFGVVDSKSDATIAKVQANTVSGVFSVNSDLIVASKSS